MNRLEEQLYSILQGSSSDLSTSQLTTRNTITAHQERVANAMRSLEEQGVVKFTGDGKWHNKKSVNFNGKQFYIGD